MAKKARTPTPPKHAVQAPKRRDPKRRAAKPAGGQRRLWGIVGVLAVVAVAAVGAALFFGLRNNNGSSSSSGQPVDYNALPGVRKIKPPWPPEYAHLDQRLLPLGLQALSAEALVYHIHDHLDIYLNGKHLTVPECIGIFGCYKNFVYLTELHTHLPDGIIHIESETKHNYKLGDFFAEWGVFLNNHCIGAYCQGYTWYVNGKKQVGDPANLVLTPHLVIVMAIGKPPKKIPSTYPWNGL